MMTLAIVVFISNRLIRARRVNLCTRERFPRIAPTLTVSDDVVFCVICVFALQGQSRGGDGGEHHQLLSQGELMEYHPRPMHSPPPLRRASLPLLTATYNPANPTPPLLHTPAHTPPPFLDALEGSSSALAHRDTQSLQSDGRSVQLAADCDMNTRQ